MSNDSPIPAPRRSPAVGSCPSPGRGRPRLLDVQHLAEHRQDGLEAPIAALLGRSAGGVALDDVELERAGSRSWQSASFPGSAIPSSAPLRMTRSRALRAASRARAAVRHFLDDPTAVGGFSSRCWMIPSVTTFWTMPLMSALPSFAFVWPSNCGSVSLTLMTAVRPSRTSSPERLAFLLAERAGLARPRVQRGRSAARKPATWVPPSTVWMLFANGRTVSAKPSLYWSATSTLVESTRRST